MSGQPRFTIVPAIDLKAGRAVRLWQGDMDKETVYSDEPEEIARCWQQAGARLIHVVDLDGAAQGKRINGKAVERIVSAVSIPIELGGGIRDRETMDAYFAMGVQRLVLGTALCRDPKALVGLLDGFPGEVLAGIDARDGWVAVDGWKEILPLTATELAASLSGMGLHGIIYTDIARDGTLRGPNLPALEKMLGETDLPLWASGGIAALDDIRSLAKLASRGLRGAIVGRALYTKDIDLKQALSVAAEGQVS